MYLDKFLHIITHYTTYYDDIVDIYNVGVW